MAQWSCGVSKPLPLAFPAKNTWLPRLALAIFHYSSWCFFRDWKVWKIRYLLYNFIRWWFSNILFLIPTWGNDPIWRAYFSKGLVQPPTSTYLYFKGPWFISCGIWTAINDGPMGLRPGWSPPSLNDSVSFASWIPGFYDDVWLSINCAHIFYLIIWTTVSSLFFVHIQIYLIYH